MSKDARFLSLALCLVTSLIIHSSLIPLLINLKSGFQEKAQQSREDFRLSLVIATKPSGAEDSESLDASEARASLSPREIITPEAYETISEFSSSRNQNTIFNSGNVLSKDEAKAAIIQLASSAETESPRARKILTQNYLTSSEESYLRAWRKKCEDIGRRNYPPKNIEGRATTRVVISRNGYLVTASIVKTSGSGMIDQAILKTIKEASPFQPFNTDMSKKYDVIEFERVWQFSKTKQIIY